MPNWSRIAISTRHLPKSVKSVNRKSPKVGFVSLGCPKALVDSERILTRLRAEGYEVVPTYREADLVVVNTCGFIDAAVDESLEAIGEALAENGKVIVTGCLGAQPRKILDRHPQVLKITGPQRYEEVVASVHEHLPPKHEPFVDLVPAQGVKLTPRHYAYLKISEGCNHRCSFCIIPSMRGDLVSRPVGEVLREAEQLARAGVKEILVISQDTSAYGVDLKYAAQPWRNVERRARFFDLSAALGELGVWIRLHYVYPYPHVDQVVELMADSQLKSSIRDPDRAQIRDRIIECIILGSQKEKELISVVDSSEDLVDLDNYFLPAIFGARSRAASTIPTSSVGYRVSLD